MPTDLFQSLASNVWAIFLVILFFGGSIFVHELGHFLAARRRGVLVERFSIGFGPAIWSWRGKDGVEYRVAWFPLGGYVLLPQLADLGAIEGESTSDAAKLPPVRYSTKMLVFVAGATFNVIFAFLLACIVWAMGQPESSDMASTRIGYLPPTLRINENTRVPSPSLRAGLEIGDTIYAIDGDRVHNWADVKNSLVLGSGRNEKGQREVVLTIERNGTRRDIVVEPILVGEGSDQVRQIGIAPGFELLVHAVDKGSVAEQAGFKPEDEILRLDDKPMINDDAFRARLDATATQPASAVVRREGREVELTIPPHPAVKSDTHLGMKLRTGFRIVHVPPHEQIADVARWTVRTLKSLLSRGSDVGLDKMHGPVGIARVLHTAATISTRAVLMITILLNVNLAIFNLLPLPVLDGGQMLFATLSKLRGRPLPVSFVATAQSVFLVLLLSMVAYVTLFSDVPRAIRENRAERAAADAAKSPAPAK